MHAPAAPALSLQCLPAWKSAIGDRCRSVGYVIRSEFLDLPIDVDVPAPILFSIDDWPAMKELGFCMKEEAAQEF